MGGILPVLAAWYCITMVAKQFHFGDWKWSNGWAFFKIDGATRALAILYAEDIYINLELMQETTNLIGPSCNVKNDYGMWRSGHRFFDTQCLNMKVTKTDIKFQCRWATDFSSGGRMVHQDMVHLYAEICNMIPTLLQPSQAL